MISRNFKLIFFWSLIASNLLLLSSALAQSSIAIKITENDLNEAVKDVEFSGSERQKFSAGFLRDISVTADWWVRNFRLDVNRDQIIVIVEVHAENGENTQIPFSYTNDVSGQASARIEGEQLLIDITSLEVPIYANPLGNNQVELTKIDVVNYLKQETIAIDLPFQESYTVNIPEVGQKKLVLGNKILQIENDYISVTSEFSVSNF